MIVYLLCYIRYLQSTLALQKLLLPDGSEFKNEVSCDHWLSAVLWIDV